MASFDERCICPKCKTTGESILAKVHPGGFKTYSVTCHNTVCKWFNINWLFDVNPDGSIPEPKKRQKAYPQIPDKTEEVRSSIDELNIRSMKGRGRRTSSE